MISRLWRKLAGRDLPEGFTGELEHEEHLLGWASTKDGAHLVATSHGLWLPEGERSRRIGWHLISKAGWTGEVMEVIESEQYDTAGRAVLLVDRPRRRFALPRPGKLPQVVRSRVTETVRSSHHREIAGGGAVFVQRKVPGRAGVVLQARGDPGTDMDAVAELAARVADQLPQPSTDER